MSDQEARGVGVVETLCRYPVKSMLGEGRERLTVTRHGVLGDRAWAVIDASTGKIASAKRPKLWRGLLTCAARTGTVEAPDEAPGAVEITLPDGTTRRAGDPDLDDALSALTGRAVRLGSAPPEGAEIDRSYPEEVLAGGAEADTEFSILTLGEGAPPGTFLDYAPLHLLTTATLDAITAAMPGDAAEPARYRPNVVIRSGASTPAFPENEWLDSIVRIGEAVTLRVILPTPRCAIPMLAHGKLPGRAAALRALVERNRVEIAGFGNQPCAGVYVSVLREGIIRQGDPVRLAPI